MKNSTVTAGVASAIALAVIVVLAGCAPAVLPKAKVGHPHPAPSTHSASAPTASPTPTPVDLGPLPANALFRITATVTEPGGASADLVQTVFAPAAPTASDTALLNTQCNIAGQPTWQSNYTSPQYVTTTIKATLHRGSPAWSASDQVTAYFIGATSAFSGAYVVAQADCAPGYITIPGTIHGVAPVDASNPALGTYGWASVFGDYGFDGGGNDPGALDSSGTGVVNNCHIEESAAATAASPIVAAWLTQTFVLANGCDFTGPNPA
ncbi:MAG TPA: hypothetical protein VIJ11_00930 [Galbitalea sp.]